MIKAHLRMLDVVWWKITLYYFDLYHSADEFSNPQLVFIFSNSVARIEVPAVIQIPGLY